MVAKTEGKNIMHSHFFISYTFPGKAPIPCRSSRDYGNDLLFVGDSSYVRELLSFTESVLQNLVDIIEQEPSRAAFGSMSLEACNCIASCFKINEHVLHVCSKLLETAKSCLNAKDKYLTSTIFGQEFACCYGPIVYYHLMHMKKCLQHLLLIRSSSSFSINHSCPAYIWI